MTPLIEISHISRIYTMGRVTVSALKDVSLSIEGGEFVAIMGHSGSGKSTLLNILGFLDRPDEGSYKLLGRETSGFSDDELSRLRCTTAGFVFQQFHLLPRMTVMENTALPLVYSGQRRQKQIHAEQMVRDVGLEHRIEHSPAELSGGEQQRVAIARSMVNDPLILFADEPTGNLDSTNEKEILSLLKKLNSRGKTIIMVTHEMEVARHANRIISMRDGEIVSDTRTKKKQKQQAPPLSEIQVLSNRFTIVEMANFIRQALSSLISHKMRSFLSILGILIGVTSVITMMGIGGGAKQSIEEGLSALGSNVLSIRPGSHRARGVSLQAGSVTRFTLEDARSLARLPEIKAASPVVMGRGQVVYSNRNWNTTVFGVSEDYESIRASHPIAGRFFSSDEVQRREKLALLGLTLVRELFAGTNPVGKTIKINRVNFLIIGVLPELGSSPHRDRDDIIIIPVTTAMYRLLGEQYVHSIEAEVKSSELIDRAQDSISSRIRQRHNIRNDADESFSIMNMAEIREAISSTSNTIAILLGIVATIALIVGGIGIMNIMLVTVKERTREIGLRKAIGARRRDILLQFIIESALLTSIGGISGIMLGIFFAVMLGVMLKWAISISLFSIIVATVVSILIGLFFGLWPAVQASRLKPVEALRYE